MPEDGHRLEELEGQIFGPKCIINVKNATGLKNKVKFGTIDPYCEVTFENHTKRTKTFDDSKNPEWNQDLEFPKPTGNTCKVQVKIHHEESLGKDKLLAYGTGTVQGFNSSDSHEVEITLIDYKQRPTDGKCTLTISGGGGDPEEDEDEDEEEVVYADENYEEEYEQIPAPKVSRQDKEEEKEEKGGFFDNIIGGGSSGDEKSEKGGGLLGKLGIGYKKEKKETKGKSGATADGGGGTKRTKGKKGTKKKGSKAPDVSAAVESAHAKIDERKLSAKEQLFQIRFIVHKARKLVGAVEHPLVRIHMDNKVLRTAPKSGKNPKFNETVVFSVNKSEKDLVNLGLEINVIDSSKPPLYAMIGAYTCDLSVAWVEKEHNMFYKWFALVNPEEPQEGMTGYVNISIQIIPPGVTAKKTPKMRPEEIDVSSNVFFPPGTSLQSGQFIVKLFTGEDFPQMDSNMLAGMKKMFSSGEKPEELVDPYVRVEFAGAKQTSQVQKGTFDPTWDQQLVIPGQFPSMAEKIVIKVFDDDEYAVDDLIATELLKMSDISFSSSDASLGFKPTFGPAYIPFYGSLREFSEVYDEYAELNFGDEEGIAYRGRVLVQIDTRMGEAPDGEKSVSVLQEQEHNNVMTSLRRHKYHLFVSFDGGNMIRETESQVEFEVSIGDYGNKLAPHGATTPSTTQPCNAVYDGTQYFYMPWGNTKPTVILHSQWEDVQYRIESLNALEWMHELLKGSIEQFCVLQTARANPPILEGKMEQILRDILLNFRNLPLVPPPANATALDQQLYKIRKFHIGPGIKKDMTAPPSFVGINTENPGATVIDIEGKVDEFAAPEKAHTIRRSTLTARPSKELTPGNKKLGLPTSLVAEAMLSSAMLGGMPQSVATDKKDIPLEFDNFIDELEAMLTGKLASRALEDKLRSLQGIKEKLKDLCFEPQMGIPDVFVWMMSGDNRIAYDRIPINHIMYSKNDICCGKKCGKSESFFLKKPRKESVGAHLTMTVWFGKFEDVASTFKPPKGSEITVFAETYEFEASVFGMGWTGGKGLPRPNFSDIGGKYELPKEAFIPPDGWEFHGNWKISMDNSLTYDSEAGLTAFIEELFEGQTRSPGRKWGSGETWWTDNKEEPILNKDDDKVKESKNAKDDLECAEGWKWAGDWKLDQNRAVDQEAWEYAMEADMGGFGPVERTYHLCRRRKWIRVRERVDDSKKKEDEIDPEGWEYAKLFSSKFHAKERKMDFARRRCWNRKLVSEIPVPIVFSIMKESDKKKDKEGEVFNMAPRIITKYEDKHIHKYQLRAYIYQARGMLGADPSGYSDPYARVIFGNRSGCTKVIKETVSPLWDTTLILDNVEICGQPEDIEANPPHVVIEFFDEDVLYGTVNRQLQRMQRIQDSTKRKIDQVEKDFNVDIPELQIDLGKVEDQYNTKTGFVIIEQVRTHRKPVSFINHDKLGRVVCKPAVFNGGPYTPTPLSWHDIGGVKRSKGELLASFELFRIGAMELPMTPPWKDKGYSLPFDITPKLQLTRVEILTWGVRSLKDYKMIPVDSPHLEIEVGGQTVTIEKIDSVKKHPNFLSPHAFIDVMLPVQEEFLPPLNIRILDNRAFGYTPLVGVATIKHYGQYRTTYDALEKESLAAKNFDTLAGGLFTDMLGGAVGGSDIVGHGAAPTADQLRIMAGMSETASITSSVSEEEPHSGTSDLISDNELKRDQKTYKKSWGRKKAKKVGKYEQLDALMVPMPDAVVIPIDIKTGSTENLIENDDNMVREFREHPEALEMQDVDFTTPENTTTNFPVNETTSECTLGGELGDIEMNVIGERSPGAMLPVDTVDIMVEPSEKGTKSRKEVRLEIRAEEEPTPDPDDILVSDWWSKYYHCIGGDPRLERIFSARRLPKMKLYDGELEKYHDNFRDLMDVIPLYRPDNEESDVEEVGEDEEDTGHSVGEFKGALKVYPITEELREAAIEAPPRLLFSNLPNNQKTDVLVRVYIVGALDLTPLDFGGNVDPYLYIKCGKTVIEDKDNYQAKQTNPIFGKMFQVRASLPRDSQLKVRVYDHDLIGANDLIGGTTIDLEDRFLSWKRASCGLSEQYIKSKTSKDRWRDVLKPTDLLKRMCLLRGFPRPKFFGEGDNLQVVVEGKTFTPTRGSRGMNNGALILQKTTSPLDTAASAKQQLALEVLHLYGLVPEHVETRTLYNDDCPGIPQGRVHLWVDIFPFNSDKIPPPIRIHPRKPQPYVLRIIVYNTMDVILDDTNILGESMSDIYVKCFMEGMKKEAQETDVHYRSLTGEGNFNWRMVYNFDYIPPEQRIVLKKKKKFYHIEKTVEKVEPNLSIQIYDKDLLTRDDILGWVELNLVSLPTPTKTAKECTLDILTDEVQFPRMSLLEKKRVRGFWPCYDDSLGERELTGKVEIELELITEEEAAEKPAGRGQEEPNNNPPLVPPNRPETSFNWFTNPWTVFKMIIWRRYKWNMLIGLIIVLAVIFFALLFYSMPQAINDAIWN